MTNQAGKGSKRIKPQIPEKELTKKLGKIDQSYIRKKVAEREKKK
jgi:hypothetical protein